MVSIRVKICNMVRSNEQASSISLHFENKGSTGGLQRHNRREPGQRHSNKNIKPDEGEGQPHLLRKMTERMAWRVDDRLERLDTELSDSERHSRRWYYRNNEQLGAGIQITGKRKKCKSRRWKLTREAKEMYGERRISFPQ